ncbi:hypothetical protein V502_02264 [Pseudogymnoascus sp. VKM F-4520 (FW-2644)]|nr:hypothetical protein V502_02264 [Pseudogymnoascus sp. VKM F-4520 (FW-2644)]
MSSRERWPSASNPQTPPVLAAFATRLSDTVGEVQALAGYPQTPPVLAAFATRLSDTVSELRALSGQALEPWVLCLPGADRDSAFTYQSSGSQKVALQLRDRGRRSSLTTGGPKPTRNPILALRRGAPRPTF